MSSKEVPPPIPQPHFVCIKKSPQLRADPQKEKTFQSKILSDLYEGKQKFSAILYDRQLISRAKLSCQ